MPTAKRGRPPKHPEGETFPLPSMVLSPAAGEVLREIENLLVELTGVRQSKVDLVEYAIREAKKSLAKKK